MDAALPPSGRAAPPMSVKRPPASSTMTCTVATSHSDTSGSAASSATSTWDQKSGFEGDGTENQFKPQVNGRWVGRGAARRR